MTEKIVKSNGVNICTECFGNPNDPALLLIMGAGTSMLGWDAGFCGRLADKGRFVIRFDNRDVGHSVSYEPGACQYSIDDMADDAVGVLDAYGIDSANIVGMSLGGVLAQIIALRHPGRARTLTLISTTNYGFDIPDLPGMEEKVLAHFMNGNEVNWSDLQSVIEFKAKGIRLMSGSRHGFDEERALRAAAEEVNRARNILSANNHVFLQGGDSYYPRFREINIPALIIHGTEDPVIPYAHALALNKEIPDSVLMTIEGLGHEIHPDDWDMIADAIIKHTAV